MKKILIISNENQKTLLNLASSEAFRIESHCQSIFREHDVYIFSENADLELQKNNALFIKRDFSSLVEMARRADVVLFFQNSHFLSKSYRISQINLPTKRMIDLYNPLHFEKLSYESGDGLRYEEVVDSINAIISHGDYFLCANKKQRDYYLGLLSSLGKIKANNGDRLPLSIVPTNLGKPQKSNSNKNNSKENDYVFFGSLYPWFDSEAALKFVKSAIKNQKNVTFFGIQNPEVKGIYRRKIEELIKDLRKFDKNYIFFENWTDSRELADKLAKYKMAVNFVDSASLEDEFAYRTRLLTLLSNGIPILTNGKDEISQKLIQEKAGCSFVAGADMDYVSRAEELSDNCLPLYKKLSTIEKKEEIKLKNYIENSDRKAGNSFSINKLIQFYFYRLRKKFSGDR